MHRSGRGRLAAASLAAVVGMLVGGCSSAWTPATGGPAGAASPGSSVSGVQVITVTYAHGVITPPEGRVVVALGHKVEIRVTSDVAEIVHNHVNDVEKDVPAGGTVVFDFTANAPGIYEVELHRSNKLLLQLQVQ